jgi:hypothetical protein
MSNAFTTTEPPPGRATTNGSVRLVPDLETGEVVGPFGQHVALARRHHDQ